MGKYLRHFDYLLLFLTLAIATIGVLAIASTTLAAHKEQYARSQVVWMSLGMVALVAATLVDYRRLANYAGLLFATTTGLLVAILAYGKIVKGAKSWFDLGFFRFQPSELAKVTLALVLAKYVASLKGPTLKLTELCTIGLITALPVALISLQPDYGTAATFFPIAGAVAFMGGIRVRYYVIVLVLVLIAAPLTYTFALKPYQQERIRTFWDPSRDPRDSGWQVTQSLIAVGSGELLGKGYRNGSQTRLHFVPEQHTDFVFTVWAEEMGFVGTGVAIALYVLLTTRVMATAAVSRDTLGAFICAGFAGSVAFQALANLAMMISLIPLTGIPLPLMSYGGTSAIVTCIFVGLVINVRMHRFERL